MFSIAFRKFAFVISVLIFGALFVAEPAHAQDRYAGGKQFERQGTDHRYAGGGMYARAGTEDGNRYVGGGMYERAGTGNGARYVGNGMYDRGTGTTDRPVGGGMYERAGTGTAIVAPTVAPQVGLRTVTTMGRPAMASHSLPTVPVHVTPTVHVPTMTLPHR